MKNISQVILLSTSCLIWYGADNVCASVNVFSGIPKSGTQNTLHTTPYLAYPHLPSAHLRGVAESSPRLVPSAESAMLTSCLPEESNRHIRVASVCFITDTGACSGEKFSNDETPGNGSGNPGGIPDYDTPQEQCQAAGYGVTSCPAGSHGDNPCPADSAYYQKCVCDANMTETCTKPYYGVGPSCDGKYASCKRDDDKACKEDGYGQTASCSSVQTPNKKCSYNSGYYDKCVCRSDLVTCTYPQSGVGEACGGKYASCQCPGSYKSCECGGAAGATSCTVNGQTTFSSCKSCCTPLASESGCKYGTMTASDGCGGTRTMCKDCTPTCANAPRWCQSSTYELVETGKDQCGNVCRECCTEYTDVNTDAFCLFIADRDIEMKYCNSSITSHIGSWRAVISKKRIYKNGIVSESKSCLSANSTEETCNLSLNLYLKSYPIGEAKTKKECQ